jgi:Domain of unknown function (DUF3291)
MTTAWHIAQLNVATALYSHEDSRMSEFFAQLDDINALADTSPGFVWRLQGESGNATDIQVTDDPLLLVNMSVWQSVESLFEFAYRSSHRRVMADRRKWFKRLDGPYQVLWWVAAGHRPGIEEGLARLQLLRQSGPCPEAFTFKSKFPPPGHAGLPEDLNPESYCSGWE